MHLISTSIESHNGDDAIKVYLILDLRLVNFHVFLFNFSNIVLVMYGRLCVICFWKASPRVSVSSHACDLYLLA
jgi:hypothetical protein